MDNVIFHQHKGPDSPKLKASDLLGLDSEVQDYLDTLQYSTTDTIPTAEPTGITDQLIIYVNAGDLRLYIYDFENSAWRYVDLT